MTSRGSCPCSLTGEHMAWPRRRYRWPFGLLVPRVWICLLCSREVRR